MKININLCLYKYLILLNLTKLEILENGRISYKNILCAGFMLMHINIWFICIFVCG
jgi:hypothetical protein